MSESEQYRKCGKVVRAYVRNKGVMTGRASWVLNKVNEQRRETSTVKQKS